MLNLYVCNSIGKEFQNRGKALRHERHNCAVKSVKEAMENVIDPHQFHCKVIDFRYKSISVLINNLHRLPRYVINPSSTPQALVNTNRSTSFLVAFSVRPVTLSSSVIWIVYRIVKPHIKCSSARSVQSYLNPRRATSTTSNCCTTVKNGNMSSALYAARSSGRSLNFRHIKARNAER